MGKNRQQYARWRADELAYLREHAGKRTDQEIAGYLHKTLASVRKHRQRLGLAKENGRGRCQLKTPKSGHCGEGGEGGEGDKSGH